jgi:predicted ribosome quality control (RQC) complex YloA/Tae2 family protein
MVKLDNTYPLNPIKIGKNQQDNDIIVKAANKEDYWFHLEDYPSCHVIIENTVENPVTNEMITYCSQLVKQNSKYKGQLNLKVMYTKIENVTPTRVLGQVVVKVKKVIKV